MYKRQALYYFSDLPKTHRKLKLLQDVGLGYLSLGQPLNTLSGGESQRLKLVKFMGSLSKNKLPSILLIDEPTTGLHMKDVSLLVETLREIVKAGHSVIVVEHNMQILKNSDWILEMGPGAGVEGGKITASGHPSSFAKKVTLTSDFLYPKNSSRILEAKNGKQKSPIIGRNKSLQILGAREITSRIYP